MKPKILYAAAGIACIILLANCNKSVAPVPTRESMIEGKWLLTGIAVDTNNNNKIDPGEIIPNPIPVIFLLNSNGSGMESDSMFGTQHFTWELSKDNQYLYISDTAISASNIQSFHIDSLKLPVMILRYNSFGTTWQIFQKQ